MRRPFDLSVYLVTDQKLGGDRDLPGIVEQAVAGGASLVQLRDPLGSTRELIAMATALKIVLDRLDVPLIINDRVDVALATGAAGVHLGSSDMRADAARALLGDEALIGLSIGDQDEWLAEQDVLRFVDYAGVGPVFSTSTKRDAGGAIGTSGLGELVTRIDLPVVAIGGIDATSAGSCIRAGADGVAVVSAIIGANDPHQAASDLKRQVLEGRSS